MSNMYGRAQPPAAPEAVNRSQQLLSPIMKVNIGIIAIVGAISIVLMLFGEFEGKGLRIFSTLLLFAFFTIFTTLDSRQTKPLNMYVGQIGSVYMLVFGLVNIWWSLALPHDRDGFGSFYYEDILWSVIGLAILTKLSIFLIQLALRTADSVHNQLAIGSKTTAFGVAITGFFYTFAIAMNPFIKFGEMYWRVTIAALLFTGLSLAITAMIYWFFKEKQPKIQYMVGDPNFPHYGMPMAPQGPQIPQPPASMNMAQQFPQNATQSFPQAAPLPVAQPLPWPLFPNGQPLPADVNGQPDFNAVQTFQAPPA